MENPNSPSANHVNEFFESFRNLYIQSQDSNNDNINFDEEDDSRNRAIAPSQPPFPYNLVFRPNTVAAPITPPWMAHVSVAAVESPPRDLGHAQDLGAFVVSPEIEMLRSLGLFGMMTSKEGSHLFPRLLNRCSENHLFFIGNRVTSDRTTFLGLVAHPVGSITVRSLLRRSVAVDDIIFGTICDNFFDLMISKHGHYVVVPTLRAVDKPKKEILYAMAVDYAMSLATQETGCAALNEFLQEMKGVHRDRILELVAMNAVWLAQDPYGNFVVQNVLSLQNPSATSNIAMELKGNFARLSVQRFGSFVVEKCLKSPYGRGHVIEEFREGDDWVRVAKDEYGNFVAQRTLRVLSEIGSPVYEELVKKLKPHFVELLRGHGRSTLRAIHSVEAKQSITRGTQKGSVGICC